MNIKFIKQYLAIIAIAAFAYPAQAVIQISSNTTWSSSQTINDYVEILPGATLTINNGAVITMNGTGYYIIVRSSETGGQGGKLSVSNATIQAAANSYWKGIFVVGRSSFSSPHINQQGVSMARAILSGATIQSAEYGVANWNIDIDYNANFSGGGIIQAVSTTFHDNNYGAYLSHFQNFAGTDTSNHQSDKCYFYKCHFLKDGLTSLPPQNGVHILVRLHGIEGVTFYGCDFTLNLGTESKYLVGYGIMLDRAGAIVREYCNGFFPPSTVCTNSIPSVFSNLRYGIYSTSPYEAHPISISNSNFEDCIYGIHIIGSQNPRIIQNNFEIYPDFSVKHSGISLESCTGFKVEENRININNGGENSLTYGIEVKNSGENANRIYRNTIIDANYAQQFNGINRGVSTNDGLKILCNNMSNTVPESYDISVTSMTGVAALQLGYGNSSILDAGNVFSTLNCTNGNNFNNDAALHVWYYCSGTDCPACYSNITVGSTGVEPNTCPINIGTQKTQPLSTAAYTTAKESLISAMEGATGVTLDGLQDEYRQLNDWMIQTYLGNYDSLGEIHYDSVLLLLAAESSNYDYQLMRAGIEAQIGNYGNALTILGNIPGNYVLDEQQRTRINNMEDMIEIASRFSDAQDDWSKLGNPDKETIASLVGEDDFIAGYMARYYQSVYEDNVIAPDLRVIQDGKWQATRHTIAAAGDVQLYPNPVSNSFQLSGVGAGWVTVLDMVGRKMYEQHIDNGGEAIDVRSLPTGMYLVRVREDSGLVHALKFTKK